MDRVGVGLAGVLVAKLGRGKGGTPVLVCHNVGENRSVLIGADGTELERLARLGSLAVDGLCELELELARSRDVGVVERGSVGAVGVGHVAFERAVTAVRNTHGHGHIGSGRPTICVVADLVHDVGERLARSVNVVRDGIETRSATNHGGSVGKGLADPIALLVGLIETEREAFALADLGAAVDDLAHRDDGFARGDVGVVERGGVGAVCVLDGLDLEVAAVLGVADRDDGPDVGGVGPACTLRGGLVHGVAVGAGGVESQLAELGGAGALDSDLVAHLLAVLVEQSEGELPGEALSLLAVDGLVHRERGAGGLGLVGVVELGSANICLGTGSVELVRDVGAQTGIGGYSHRDGGDDVRGVRPTLRGGCDLVDAIGVGLAGVLVGELGHGEGGRAVLTGGDVLKRGRALVGGGGGELERLPCLGSGTVDGLAHRELELAGGLPVHVVEEGRLRVLRGRGVRDSAGRERAVAVVGADRDGRGHVAGHGPAHRGRRGLMNEVLVGLTGVCQAELDLAEGGAGGAHRRGDVGLGHGSSHAGCPELEIKLLVGLGSRAVHGLGDEDGRRARCLVEVVELSRTHVRPVIDRSDKPVGGRVHLDVHRNNHVVVSGPSIAVVANLVNHIRIRAGLVKRQLVKGRRAAGRDAHRTAELLARGLAIGIGLVKRKLKDLVGLDGGRTVHGLAHRDDSLAVGNMEVVERSRAAVGNRTIVVDLRHKVARSVVNGDLDRDVDVCVIGPTHTQVSGLVDNVLVHARLAKGDGTELGSARTGHRQRRATLGHGSVRRGSLELERKLLVDGVVLFAVDHLVHSKRRGGGLCLVGIVELSDAHIGLGALGVEPVRDVRREHAGVGGHAHRDGRNDVGGVGPALRGLRDLVDAVGVGLAGVLVGELGRGEGGGAVLDSGDVLKRRRVGGVVALGGGRELERLAGLGRQAVDGLRQAELELARHNKGVVLLVGDVERGRRARLSNANRLGLVERLLVLLLAVGALEHEVRLVAGALIACGSLGLHEVVERVGQKRRLLGAELHHAVVVAHLRANKRLGAVPGNLVQLERGAAEDLLGVGSVRLRDGDAVARSLGGGAGLHDGPQLLVRGGAVGNAGDLGTVRQADLVARVAGGLHLIYHVDCARIGNGKRQPRGARAVVKRDVLGEGGAAWHLGGRALVVHVERGRQVGALGVHRVHERERVGARHEVDRVLVHRDGVLDVGAVGHLLGRLHHDLVRALDGLETGGERLRASLGVGLVGELHGSTGIAQCRAVHGSLILKLNVIVNVSLDTLDVRLHGEDGGGALAGRFGGQRRPMANRAVVAAMQVVPGAARHIHHVLGHLVGDDDVDATQGTGRGGGPPVGLHLVDKNRPVGDPGAPLGGAGLNLAPIEVGVPVHVAVLGDFRRLIGLDGEARLGRLGHRGRPEGGLVRIGVVGTVALGAVGHRHIGGADKGPLRIACHKGELELVPLAIVCDLVVHALNELIVTRHELELVKRRALVLAGIELVGKGHLRRVGVGRHARHEDRGLPGGVAIGGGSLGAHELLGDVLGVVGGNEAGRRIALRALPAGVLDGELVVHRVLGGGVGHLGVVHDGVRLLAGVGTKGIAEARAVGGQRTRGDGCAGSILDLVAALVGMARAERVGKDIAGHVSLERARVDRGRPGDVVRGARSLLACHVDGKLGAGGTDVVLVVLAVGTPRPAGRVVHAGKLATVGDRLPCVGRDGRGVG